MRPGRAPAWAVVLLVVAAAVTGAELTSTPYPPASAAPMPRVLTDAASQAWYCGLGTGVANGQADATVVMANSGSAVLRGTITVFANGGGQPSAPRPVALGPRSRGSLRLGDMAAGPFVAAEVIFSGPDGSAELQVSGPLGVSAAPCANGPSSDWYFSGGTTKNGASLILGLLNPFPEDAIVDLSFADDSGFEAPGPFQGVYVPAHSLVAVDLDAHVVEQQAVSTTVSVRVGRLVASKLQLDTIPGQAGLSVVTGAPVAASRWFLPDGVIQAGVGEQLHVYNPTGATAQVSIAPHLAQGQASPFQLSLPDHSEQVLDLTHQPRIPAGDDFSLVATSTAPVVIERTVQSVSPAPRQGIGEMLAAPEAASRWVLTSGGTTSSQDEYVTILDPGRDPARVSLYYLNAGVAQPVPGVGTVTVAPGANSNLRLGQYLSVADLTVVVSADRPVVVERDLFQVGGSGLSLAVGEPVVSSVP